MEPAIQVSPVKEEDMSFVREVFERMANNVVAATALSTQVQEMQRNVDSLASIVEKLKTDVTYYSDQASAFRRKAEELERDLIATRRDRDEISVQLDQEKRATAILRSDAEHSRSHIETITKDRDEAQIKVMELEEELKTSKARIMQVEDFASDILNVIKPDKANEPAALPNPLASGSTQNSSGGSALNPFPPVEHPSTPDPAPSPQVIDSNSPSFDWSKPYEWSNERNAYVYTTPTRETDHF